MIENIIESNSSARFSITGDFNCNKYDSGHDCHLLLQSVYILTD